MRIAIIDSGIDKTHKRLNNCKTEGIFIIEKDNTIEFFEDYLDVTGHGTGIANIIYGFVPKAELVIVKVFHKELKTNERVICAAIKWCLNKNINIINLSLGIQTNSPIKELHELCIECFKKNIVLVASAHYYNLACYPAYFPEVFGVSAGMVKNKYEYGYIPNLPIEFLAKGTVQRIATINGGYKIVDGTSFACANFTGIIGKLIETHTELKTISGIKEALVKNAYANVKPIYKLNIQANEPIIIKHDLEQICEKWINREKKLNWLGRLAIFPASEKEMNSFIKFPNLSKYPINYYLDYPKTFDELNDNTDYHLSIHKEIPSDEDSELYESIVVGYFHEHLFNSNVRFGENLIKENIFRNKNFFIFDKSFYNHFQKYLKKEKGVNIYCPIVSKEIADDINAFRFHDNIKMPTLAVIGTSNRQGKFTTQLRIKEILTIEGYKIAHLSTEPQGELFGADFSFPIGYNSTVEIPFDTWPMFLRSLTKAMEYYLKPDLFITGTQGWVVPRGFSYPRDNIFDIMQFIHGIQPDGIICAINPNDTFEIIHKNIEAAKSVSNAKLIMCTMTPWLREFIGTGENSVSNFKLLTKEEMENKLNFYRNELQVPIIDIMDKSNEKLVLETIEMFYS